MTENRGINLNGNDNFIAMFKAFADAWVAYRAYAKLSGYGVPYDVWEPRCANGWRPDGDAMTFLHGAVCSSLAELSGNRDGMLYFHDFPEGDEWEYRIEIDYIADENTFEWRAVPMPSGSGTVEIGPPMTGPRN